MIGNILSPTHLFLILLIVLILFGRGKISELMGDFGKGISSFKKGLSEGEHSAARQEEKTSAETDAEAQRRKI